MPRALVEAILFGGIFLVAGHVSLGLSVPAMLSPMVLFVFIMMLSMVCSGVYRSEITNSIMNLYIHSAYGFCIAAILCVSAAYFLEPQYANLKFEFFFLFSAFFVMNTMSPLLSGTDFMDGGARRDNWQRD
ncbi:MAG: hypothetical protein KTR32_07910 [Granulosicoccus sp.]|nr:hypothetical protein [Granulosicoccus sp.]